MTGKWLGALKWMVVAVVAGIIVWLVWSWNRKGGMDVEIGFDHRIELTSQEVRRIEQIGQWEFLSVQTEIVADTVREGFFSDDRLVVIYAGTPHIGIDMGRAGKDWVQAQGDTVRLRLPSVHLLDTDFVDEARMRVFYESGDWPNAARRDLYARAVRDMSRQALTPSNLHRAEQNARSLFTAMFRALGFHTVEITFE